MEHLESTLPPSKCSKAGITWSGTKQHATHHADDRENTRREENWREENWREEERRREDTSEPEHKHEYMYAYEIRSPDAESQRK